MVYLCGEEERYLQELVDVDARGESVKDFISKRLYEELSHVVEKDRYGNEVRDYEPGYQRALDAYDALVEHCMLQGTKPVHGIVWHEELTPAGRSYFSDKAREDEERKREIASDRRFQIMLSVATLVLSTAFGAVSGCVSSKLAQQPVQVEVSHPVQVDVLNP